MLILFYFKCSSDNRPAEKEDKARRYCINIYTRNLHKNVDSGVIR